MDERFSRTRLLIGEEGQARLREACVVVAGLGGVGGYALEALARAGVGTLYLIDDDCFDVTNINRQLLALTETVGSPKVEVARRRVRSINPEADVHALQCRLTPGNIGEVLPERVAYAVDAIDSVDAKVHMLAHLHRRGARTVSCMGAANRLSPAALHVADISKTRVCPLAKAVRRRLRALGVERGIPCVYSEEHPLPVADGREEGMPLGTISHVPGIMGLMAGGLIINGILESGS